MRGMPPSPKAEPTALGEWETEEVRDGPGARRPRRRDCPSPSSPSPTRSATTSSARCGPTSWTASTTRYSYGNATAPQLDGLLLSTNATRPSSPPTSTPRPARARTTKALRVLKACPRTPSRLGRDLIDLRPGPDWRTSPKSSRRLYAKDKAQLDLFRYNPVTGDVMCHTARRASQWPGWTSPAPPSADKALAIASEVQRDPLRGRR